MRPEAFRTARMASARRAPARQPATARTAPSARNIAWIRPGRVPIARRVPISRVRSVTDIVITIAADRMTMTIEHRADEAEDPDVKELHRAVENGEVFPSAEGNRIPGRVQRALEPGGDDRFVRAGSKVEDELRDRSGGFEKARHQAQPGGEVTVVQLLDEDVDEARHDAVDRVQRPFGCRCHQGDAIARLRADRRGQAGAEHDVLGVRTRQIRSGNDELPREGGGALGARIDTEPEERHRLRAVRREPDELDPGQHRLRRRGRPPRRPARASRVLQAELERRLLGAAHRAAVHGLEVADRCGSSPPSTPRRTER